MQESKVVSRSLNSLSYKGLRFFWRAYARFFFEEFRVISCDKNGLFRVEDSSYVPPEHSFLLVNHPNSLIDALSICMSTPQQIRFMAMHVLWKHLVLRPFLWFGGVIPVYRKVDLDKEKLQKGTSKKSLQDNLESAAKVAKAIQFNPICLFAEGTTHFDPHIKPLKSGILRFLEECARYDGVEVEKLGVQIVSLFYESRLRFRCRALVIYGDWFGYQDIKKMAENDRARLDIFRESMGRNLVESMNVDQKHKLRRVAKVLSEPETSIIGLWGFEREISKNDVLRNDPEFETLLKDYYSSIDKLGLSVDRFKLHAYSYKQNMFTFVIQNIFKLIISPFLILLFFPYFLATILSDFITERIVEDPIEKGTYRYLGYMVFALGIFMLSNLLLVFSSLEHKLYWIFYLNIYAVLSFWAFPWAYDLLRSLESTLKLILLPSFQKNFNLAHEQERKVIAYYLRNVASKNSEGIL